MSRHVGPTSQAQVEAELLPSGRGGTGVAGEPGARGEQVRRAVAVDDELIELYPDARCDLVHDGPFELLVATVLSAQTTDKRVNTVTPALFDACPDATRLTGADRAWLESVVRPLGMGPTRAARLVALGTALTVEYDGVVPSTRAALTALPGVGRKTANVVLGNAFGVPALTVDTHVGRLARRLGWSERTEPLAVEKDIAALLPPERWTDGCHRLIWHGRAVCRARSPRCGQCSLLDAGLCPQVGI